MVSRGKINYFIQAGIYSLPANNGLTNSFYRYESNRASANHIGWYVTWYESSYMKEGFRKVLEKIWISDTKKAALERLDCITWCRRPDSNRHVFLRLILNQLRLPISPLRHWRGCGNVTDYTCHARPCKQERLCNALSDEKNSVILVLTPLQSHFCL